ncbi:MAG: hypothetical protein VX463_13965, partial [Pseudomonadota bacterium]|nr:hypothetical protein [Pseudomonadota bacterium]
LTRHLPLIRRHYARHGLLAASGILRQTEQEHAVSLLLFRDEDALVSALADTGVLLGDLRNMTDALLDIRLVYDDERPDAPPVRADPPAPQPEAAAAAVA